MPGPGVCVGGCLRVVTRGMGVGGRFRGASGTPPPTGCPGKGGSGSLPLIRPCGATFPRGGRQGLQGRDSSLPGKGDSGRSRRGGGTPPYGWGDMETLWGLREQSFPGRRAVGAGHARPGGLRRQASTVRSVGRGLDPSAGGCPGDGCRRKPSRGVGDAAPCGLPGMGGSGRLPLIRPCGATFPRGGRQGLLLAAAGACPTTPAVDPRCGAGGSGCSTSGLTKPALYRRNPGRCRGGSRR